MAAGTGNGTGTSLIAVITLGSTLAGSSSETSQPEAKCDTAGNEQRWIVSRHAIHILEELIDIFAAQAVRELHHALRHVGDIIGQSKTVLTLKLLSSCFSALGHFLNFISCGFPIAFQLRFTLRLHLVGCLTRCRFRVISDMTGRAGAGVLGCTGCMTATRPHSRACRAGGARAGGAGCGIGAGLGLATVTSNFVVGCSHLIHLLYGLAGRPRSVGTQQERWAANCVVFGAHIYGDRG